MVIKDPWIPRSPSFLPITQGITDNLTVSEFIHSPGIWNTELIQQIFWPPDSELILTIPLSPFDHSDSWIWHYSKKGNYSVRSGYNLAMKADNSSSSSSAELISNWWESFRGLKISRKFILFGWRGYHEILPITKGLYRKNVSRNSNCPLCGFGGDSNAHAVFWCPFSQEVLELLEYQFLIGHKEEINFNGVLLYASERLEKETFTKMLIAAWILWTERNKVTHGEQRRTPQQINTWILSYCEEVRNAHIAERKITLRGESSYGGQLDVQPNDYVLFVDVASSASSHKVGLGAAILASSKEVLTTLSKPLEGVLSVFQAEALALLAGLRWAQTIGLPVSMVLSDSLSLVKALENGTDYLNESGILQSDIKILLSSFLEAVVAHVRRNSNVKAHNLAKHALQLEEESVWMAEITNQAEIHNQ